MSGRPARLPLPYRCWCEPEAMVGWLSPTINIKCVNKSTPLYLVEIPANSLWISCGLCHKPRHRFRPLTGAPRPSPTRGGGAPLYPPRHSSESWNPADGPPWTPAFAGVTGSCGQPSAPLASFAGLTGESMSPQRAGRDMDPPVKPEGDGGWAGARAPSVPPASSSFAGLTGESICVQRADGEMDPPVKPEGDASGGRA